MTTNVKDKMIMDQREFYINVDLNVKVSKKRMANDKHST